MSRRMSISVLVVAAIAIAAPPRAQATCGGTWTPIYVCNGGPGGTSTRCTNQCFLGNDINCPSGLGILLSSGAKLDMCGKKIHCTDSQECYGAQKAAITMDQGGSNNQVFTSVAGATIDGPWFTGVECNNATSSKVTGISVNGVINGVAGWIIVGTDNCAKVEQNVFSGIAAGAIETTGVSNTDYIRNNYISGSGTAAIDIASQNVAFDVDHNMISTSNGTAIALSDTAGFSGGTINNNIIFGPDVPITDNAYATVITFSNNYCDVANSSACSQCVSEGLCTAAAPPFSLP